VKLVLVAQSQEMLLPLGFNDDNWFSHLEGTARGLLWFSDICFLQLIPSVQTFKRRPRPVAGAAMAGRSILKP